MARNRRDRQSQVLVMALQNVIDQLWQRRMRRVIVVLFAGRRQSLKRAADHFRINGSAPACLINGSSAAATEVDSKMLENRCGSKIVGNDLADSGSLE